MSIHILNQQVLRSDGGRWAIRSRRVGVEVDRRCRSVALLYGAHFDALEREHLAAACNANHIGRINPRPVLAINGLHDMDHMKEPSVAPLLKLAKEPREVVWAATGHQSALDDELRGRMPGSELHQVLRWCRVVRNHDRRRRNGRRRPARPVRDPRSLP